jgi:rod shape-determining protein MreC
MKFLFLFLKKQYFFFLFVTLELLAFVILANHNNYQKRSIIGSTNIIAASIHSAYASVTDYFFLKEANRQLNAENARLKQFESFMSNHADSLSGFFDDTTLFFIPARVISNSTQNRNNYIMINKGRLQGVEKETGLLSPSGVAGIIIEVSRHHALAISLLHKDARISAKLKSNGQLVNVSWDGADYRTGLVEDIPAHIIPKTGDTVITSGYSFIFPENITIGTIGEQVYTGGNLNTARIRFSTDFNKLFHVYVTGNIITQEIDSLKQIMINE